MCEGGDLYADGVLPGGLCGDDDGECDTDGEHEEVRVVEAVWEGREVCGEGREGV